MKFYEFSIFRISFFFSNFQFFNFKTKSEFIWSSQNSDISLDRKNSRLRTESGLVSMMDISGPRNPYSKTLILRPNGLVELTTQTVGHNLEPHLRQDLCFTVCFKKPRPVHFYDSNRKSHGLV